MRQINQVIDAITRLKIQGATNVAISAVTAFAEYAHHIRSKSYPEFLEQLQKVRNRILNTRPTEPAMRNGINYLFALTHNKELSLPKLCELMDTRAKQYIELLQTSRAKIGRIGAKRILESTTVMTHCHSSAVDAILIHTKKQGRTFQVIATETRPLFQGRRTTTILLEHGIPVTLVVDSAMRWALRRFQPDIVLVGADVITSTGAIVNKIGTKLLALAAKELDVPFYSASSILKFDPLTTEGALSEIEERAPTEIWPDAPPTLTVRNPAFEVVSREYLDGVVTEMGIWPPSMIPYIFARKFPEMLEAIGE
ncbi:MAG: translation initiation factor eIF-2B [Candidatus Heimdallarchaeota archaeon]